VVCIAQNDQRSALGSFSGGATIISEDAGPLPANAGLTEFCVLTGSRYTDFGMGEISADDVLATVLLGGNRDRDRKKTEIAARRIVSWIYQRSLYENR
jgi:hypothetical protein